MNICQIHNCELFICRIQLLYCKGSGNFEVKSNFDNKMKAIQMCNNRFDDDTKNSFVELYTKVDAGANAESIMEDQRKAEINSQVDDNDSESSDEENSSGY